MLQAKEGTTQNGEKKTKMHEGNKKMKGDK